MTYKDKIEDYFTEKLELHGANHSGVDWKSKYVQELAFSQILKICDKNTSFTINDLGCGYGHLYKYMTENNYNFDYYGYDVSEKMIQKANELFNADNSNFIPGGSLKPADYTVESGIFNIKFDVPFDDWQQYVLNTIINMDKNSNKGFAFNLLTKYSDKELMKNNLYYADPCFYFDYCKTHFSKNVALLHDYGLYEFTILVRKQ